MIKKLLSIPVLAINDYLGSVRCQHTLFKIWAFPGLFLDFIFYWFNVYIFQLTNFDIGDRKQERRRKSRLYSLFFRKSLAPSENTFTAILNQKSQVCPGIQTRLARTECHCSTACATTITLRWHPIGKNNIFDLNKIILAAKKSMSTCK